MIGFNITSALRRLTVFLLPVLITAVVDGSERATAQESPDKFNGTGTAFSVSSDGYMLTCDHVVAGASGIWVLIDDKFVSASIVAQDGVLDIALIKVNIAGTTPLPIAYGTRVQLGEQVSVAGFPFGDTLGKSLKVSSGTISGINNSQREQSLQIDAAVNPGNSGGPLLNARGEVIGIVNAKLTGENVTAIGFAIPINYAMVMLNDEGATPMMNAANVGALSSVDRAAIAEQSTHLVRVNVPDNARNAHKTTGSYKRKIHYNPVDNAQLTFIPAGDFIMGDDTNASIKSINPKHIAKMSGYWIYTRPVTVEMYQKFCAATGRAMPRAPEFSEQWHFPEHPIVNVSWNDASAYCAWAGGKLPTSAQWEKAARGPDGLRYPWGNDYDPTKLWASSVVRGTAGGTVIAGGFGKSPYGCSDMAGNVNEWCRDWFDDKFWQRVNPSESDPNNQSVGEKKYRCMRGGSWQQFAPKDFLSAQIYWNVPTFTSTDSGFRCVFNAP